MNLYKLYTGVESDDEVDENDKTKIRNSDVETDDERTPSPNDNISKVSTSQRKSSGSKSKAKLSSHDDGYHSSEPNQGNR